MAENPLWRKADMIPNFAQVTYHKKGKTPSINAIEGHYEGTGGESDFYGSRKL